LKEPEHKGRAASTRGTTVEEGIKALFNALRMYETGYLSTRERCFSG
jgi:hypothetical protein